MRGHAHGLTAHGDIDVGRSKALRQIGRHSAAEAQSEIVSRTALGRHAGDGEFAARALGDGARAQPQRLADARHRPLQDQVERGFGHRHQCKVAALADVETARARLKVVAVVDQAGEILGALARDPIVLDGATALPARRNVEKSETVWPEQPFVAGDGDKIRIDPLHVERQRADRLGGIHAERGADAATRRRDRLEVDEPAVGPMTLRHGDDRGRCIDGRKQRGSPIVVAGARDRDESGPGSLGQIHPRIDVGWKLLRQRHDALRPSDRNIVRRLRHAVGHRWGEGDIVRVGVDEVGKQFPHHLARRKEIGRCNGPGLGLAPQPAITGAQRDFRQRRYVGAVQKRDVVRDLEKMTLARKCEPRARV